MDFCSWGAWFKGGQTHVVVTQVEIMRPSAACAAANQVAAVVKMLVGWLVCWFVSWLENGETWGTLVELFVVFEAHVYICDLHGDFPCLHAAMWS